MIAGSSDCAAARIIVRLFGCGCGFEPLKSRQEPLGLRVGFGFVDCWAGGATRRRVVATPGCVDRVCADAEASANRNATTNATNSAAALVRVRRMLHRIVRRFLSDRNVMRMVLPNRRRCDLDELRLRSKFLDRLCSDIAHS